MKCIPQIIVTILNTGAMDTRYLGALHPKGQDNGVAPVFPPTLVAIGQVASGRLMQTCTGCSLAPTLPFYLATLCLLYRI